MHKNHNATLDIHGVNSHLIICNAILCPLYNLITLKGILTKFHTFVKHIQTVKHIQMKCHTQEQNSCLYIFQIIPLVT